MPNQRVLTEEELDNLLGSLKGPADIGRRAALRLALAGLRSSQLTALQRDDLAPDADESVPAVVVTFKSKRLSQPRVLKISGEAALDIMAFISSSGDRMRFDLPTALGATPNEVLPYTTFRHTVAARLLRNRPMPDDDPAAD